MNENMIILVSITKIQQCDTIREDWRATEHNLREQARWENFVTELDGWNGPSESEGVYHIYQELLRPSLFLKTPAKTITPEP